MKKIPSLFKRDYEGARLVYDEVVPGCEWVLAGEGVATRKHDGTACLVQEGKLYKRYDAKKGKTPPEGFIPCEDAPDPNTGHWPGWLLVGDGPEDRWHREAWEFAGASLPGGTYELVGPKIQGGAEFWSPCQQLVRHGVMEFVLPRPLTFVSIRGFLTEHEMEGVVWHHPDGRACKIKRKDFGLPWPVKRERI